MRIRPDVTVRVEEIMTPRSLLKTVPASAVTEASRLATENEFEAIPIVRDGQIGEFWRRRTGRVYRITDRHRVQYYESVANILRRLAARVIQFVCYRNEVVGLLDLSDRNKPLARLVWLHPLLEMEQAIFTAVRTRGISDEAVREKLGSSAKRVEQRRHKARKEDLGFPLLEFADFPDVLKVGKEFGIVSLSTQEICSLNSVRRRSAHGVARPIEKQSDGKELVQVLALCNRFLIEIGAAAKP